MYLKSCNFKNSSSETIYKWHPVTDGGMDPELFDPKMGYIPESSSLLGQLQAIFAEMEFGNAKYVKQKKSKKLKTLCHTIFHNFQGR
jgi:hypothetical protein